MAFCLNETQLFFIAPPSQLAKMAPKSCAIGIDLGTANTRFAIYRHDRFEVIPHEGQSMMPSYVAFTETGRLIGQAAKNQAGLNPKNTIFDAVRFVGPAFQDSYIQELTTWLPFTITHDGAEVEAKRKPVFEVMYKGELTIFTPVEILAMIVKRVRKEAEEYLGHPVVDAVVTIPAHFNISQRFAIKDALSIAGINALGIYHAPAVAVSDLTITQKMNQMQNVLICDIGAVHYDVVLATAEDGIVQVEAVCGDMNHAGYDYDRRLIHYMINCFRRATKKDFGDEGMVDRNDITNNPRALRRLSTACKKAKHQLSSADMAIIEIEQLHDGKDLNESITRVKFEELILDHIRFLLEPIERLLRDAKLSKSEIHQIHLIGGSSRIPKTQKIISDFFDGKTALRCLNIEETLARGAAIHASILSGDTTSKTATEILLLDAASQSLGIQTNDGIIKPLIKRGCTLPNIKQEVFSTSQDNQESFSVTCYEGDGAHMRDNMKLGYAQISIPPAPRGVPQLAVRFDIDARYNLEVSISEKGTGKKSLVKMDGYNSQGFDRISKSELQRLILAEEQMEAEDHLEEMRIEARNTTEELAYNIKDWIKCLTPARRCHSITNLETLTDQCFEWLDEHQFAPVSRYETVTRQLQELRLQAEKEQVAHESSYSRQELEQQESIIEESTKRNEETKKRHEGADSAQSEAKSDIIMSDAPDAGRKPELESKGPDFLLNGVAGKQDQAEAGLDEAASVPIVQTLEQSLSGTTPTAKRTLGNIGPARPDTTRTATRGMASLFDKPAKGGFTFTDTELVQISTYLKNTGQPDWSKVPRLYAILRLINELEMLDVFIQQGITDIWIPFAQTTLPRAMSPSAKANFLKHQEAVLSKSLLFEKSADKRHTRFLQGEPLPYEVVGKLGAGAHGQVDKVMSTVSHREYARKLFRRVRGMTRDAINSFLIELQVLKRVQHYHCIELVRLSQEIQTAQILIDNRCKAIRTQSISP